MKDDTVDDKTLLERVGALVDEENRLREEKAAPERHAERLRAIAVELDQCWDLLRQRRARREFGQDPDDAKPRDPRTVEGYLN